MRKLEIGSGNRPLNGFEHLDINPDCPCLEYVAPMDKIPVENNTFDEIHCIHVIEHTPWRNTQNTINEWIRILKPEGKIKIACPNLRWILESYSNFLQGNTNELLNDANKMTPDEIKHISINDQIDPGLWTNFKIMSSGCEFDQHYACLDSKMLSKMLIRAGCKNVHIDHDGDSLVIWGYK